VSIGKIYINGKFLTQQTTGVQAYAIGMIEAMERQNIQFEILTPKSTKLSDRFNVKRIGFFSNSNLWEQCSLPLYVNKQPNSILINFCNSAPLLSNFQIVTIHDLAFEQRDVNWFSLGFRLWYRFLIPRISKTASFIFTVSEFSKQEIVSNYKIKTDDIKIIPNGLNCPIEIAPQQIKEKYVLLVGGNNPRKNADYIIERVKDIEKQGLKLVILNGKKAVFNSISKTVHPSIIYLNYTTESEYYSLIKYAKALIYSSLYEGFGIPILESLCLKTPVICSDLLVFRESFGNLPIYYNASDSFDFRKALEKLRDATISDLDVEKLKQKYSFDESVSLILKTLKEL
jgi:glycosyltransferase involved in cell wall biosynthesis